MTPKVRKLSPKARARIVAGLKRSWQPGGTHREMQRRRGIRSDAETERRRAAWDAKGKPIFDAVLRNGLHVHVTVSLRGRSDQFDVECGSTSFTASGPRCWRYLLALSLS